MPYTMIGIDYITLSPAEKNGFSRQCKILEPKKKKTQNAVKSDVRGRGGVAKESKSHLFLFSCYGAAGDGR